MRRFRSGFGLWILVLASGLAAAGDPVGTLYTATNAPGGNAVVALDRHADGSLGRPLLFPTGGSGTGTGLGNQGGLALSRDRRRLLVVNAASDSISSFRVEPGGLVLADVEPSGGSIPISVDVHRDRVYVVHTGGCCGGADGIAGFELGPEGELSPLADSTRPLSEDATFPAQIAFSPRGESLVVTEQGTDRIVVFPLDRERRPRPPIVRASSGPTPFGFAWSPLAGLRSAEDVLIVSEAAGGTPNASSVSSYRFTPSALRPVSEAVPTGETAACWIAITPDGRHAYTTNTHSHSVSSFEVGRDGSLTLLDARAGTTGPGLPLDAVVTPDGLYLYVLSASNGTIYGWRIGFYGGLTPLPPVGGLPAGSNGLAVR